MKSKIKSLHYKVISGKVHKNGVLKPLTQKERDWIIKTVKVLIRRAGEWAYDPTGQHSLITMEQI